MARPLTRLVVLPFRLLRPDPEIDFLSFALADAVSASLAGLPSVVIRSSAAAARFATESPDLKALADAGRRRPRAHGHPAPRGRPAAGHDPARGGAGRDARLLPDAAGARSGDVFRLQDELAQRIVESLSPSLSEREGPRRRGVPASARAYEFYLRANEVVRDWSQVAVARDLYRQCVDEDPSFAPAWAKLGRCHRLLAKYYLERPEENLARADEAFRRALELDPELPVAHKLYAHREAEMGRARDAMVRLLGLARSTRNDPEIFAGLVHACRYCGLLDASEAAHREARRLDPHISTSVVYTWWARGEMERVIAETSDAGDFELRTMAFEALGRKDEARTTLKADPGLVPVPGVRAIQPGPARPPRPEPEAAEAFAELAATHSDPEALFMYAACQARVGDTVARSCHRSSPPSTAASPSPRPCASPLARAAPRRPALGASGDARRGLPARRREQAFREAGGPALLGA